jgi:hypothetical protein
VDRAERGEVLERHLRRAVLADRHAGVRAREADVRLRDRRHADEVVGRGEERSERRRERLPLAHLQPDRRGDQLLLGDVHLEVTLGKRLRELIRVGRVRDLAVERDDAAVRLADREQRVAVRLPRRDLGTEVVRWQLESARLERVRLSVALGLVHVDDDVALAAELRDRRLGIVERLAVPARPCSRPPSRPCP